MKKFGIEYQEFLLRFVRTENNLIAFWGPSNCVNTQYTALSGAMAASWHVQMTSFVHVCDVKSAEVLNLFNNCKK